MTTRRGLFGLLAGAAAAAPALAATKLAEAAPIAAGPVIGEIRTVAEAVMCTGLHTHGLPSHTHGFSFASTCPVSGYEARHVNHIWTGARWAPLDSQDGAETVRLSLEKAIALGT